MSFGLAIFAFAIWIDFRLNEIGNCRFYCKMNRSIMRLDLIKLFFGQLQFSLIRWSKNAHFQIISQSFFIPIDDWLNSMPFLTNLENLIFRINHLWIQIFPRIPELSSLCTFLEFIRIWGCFWFSLFSGLTSLKIIVSLSPSQLHDLFELRFIRDDLTFGRIRWSLLLILWLRGELREKLGRYSMINIFPVSLSLISQ